MIMLSGLLFVLTGCFFAQPLKGHVEVMSGHRNGAPDALEALYRPKGLGGI